MKLKNKIAHVVVAAAIVQTFQNKVQGTYLKTFFESIDPLGFALKSKGCSPIV